MVKENLARIREEIAETASRVNRKSEDVRLVCVTKNATVDQVKEVMASGITDVGENRVQDALSKYNSLGDRARRLKWHMIGHLQTNKVKKALEIFDTIHSLDRLPLAEAIDKRSYSLGKRTDCFIEVNTSREASKYGIAPEEAVTFIKEVSNFSNIHIIGLMTMAPFVDNRELARPYFAKLHTIKEKLQAEEIPSTDIKELSMGMTQDFTVAIEEGATYLRIGSAIFRD